MKHLRKRGPGSAGRRAKALRLALRDREQRLRQARLELAARDQQLRGLHVDLLSSAHKAGMSEVATGVLHNLVNVMNGVGVTASSCRDRVERSSATLLVKVSKLLLRQGRGGAELAAFLTTDPRGAAIPSAIASIAMDLENERSKLLEDLTGMLESLRHMAYLINSQQELARTVTRQEEVELAPLLDRAIALAGGNFAEERISLVRDYQDTDLVCINAHLVAQIVMNLLSNARQALAENHAARVVIVRAARVGDNLVISVADNGHGVPADLLGRIFDHGFSTREGGHGFGLHISQLSAKEMGGTLNVQSEGPGSGATFTLTIPLGRRNTVPLRAPESDRGAA
jgi:signal transduction histidine kinase